MPSPRFRCTACGNLTRFDVVTSRRTRAFHHYTVGGELSVEDEEVLDEQVEEITCRWCGTGTAVEPLGSEFAADEPSGSGPPAVGPLGSGPPAVNAVAEAEAGS